MRVGTALLDQRKNGELFESSSEDEDGRPRTLTPRRKFRTIFGSPSSEEDERPKDDAPARHKEPAEWSQRAVPMIDDTGVHGVSPPVKPKRRLPDTITRLLTPPLPSAGSCDAEESDASEEEDKDEVPSPRTKKHGRRLPSTFSLPTPPRYSSAEDDGDDDLVTEGVRMERTRQVALRLGSGPGLKRYAERREKVDSSGDDADDCQPHARKGRVERGGCREDEEGGEVTCDEWGEPIRVRKKVKTDMRATQQTCRSASRAQGGKRAVRGGGGRTCRSRRKKEPQPPPDETPEERAERERREKLGAEAMAVYTKVNALGVKVQRLTGLLAKGLFEKERAQNALRRKRRELARAREQRMLHGENSDDDVDVVQERHKPSQTRVQAPTLTVAPGTAPPPRPAIPLRQELVLDEDEVMMLDEPRSQDDEDLAFAETQPVPCGTPVQAWTCAASSIQLRPEVVDLVSDGDEGTKDGCTVWGGHVDHDAVADAKTQGIACAMEVVEKLAGNRTLVRGTADELTRASSSRTPPPSPLPQPSPFLRRLPEPAWALLYDLLRTTDLAVVSQTSRAVKDCVRPELRRRKKALSRELRVQLQKLENEAKEMETEAKAKRLEVVRVQEAVHLQSLESGRFRLDSAVETTDKAFKGARYHPARLGPKRPMGVSAGLPEDLELDRMMGAPGPVALGLAASAPILARPALIFTPKLVVNAPAAVAKPHTLCEAEVDTRNPPHALIVSSVSSDRQLTESIIPTSHQQPPSILTHDEVQPSRIESRSILERLNDDTVMHVVLFLTVKDLASCLMVCKSVSGVFQSKEAWQWFAKYGKKCMSGPELAVMVDEEAEEGDEVMDAETSTDESDGVINDVAPDYETASGSEGEGKGMEVVQGPVLREDYKTKVLSAAITTKLQKDNNINSKSLRVLKVAARLRVSSWKVRTVLNSKTLLKDLLRHLPAGNNLIQEITPNGQFGLGLLRPQEGCRYLINRQVAFYPTRKPNKDTPTTDPHNLADLAAQTAVAKLQLKESKHRLEELKIILRETLPPGKTRIIVPNNQGSICVSDASGRFIKWVKYKVVLSLWTQLSRAAQLEFIKSGMIEEVVERTSTRLFCHQVRAKKGKTGMAQADITRASQLPVWTDMQLANPSGSETE